MERFKSLSELTTEETMPGRCWTLDPSFWVQLARKISGSQQYQVVRVTGGGPEPLRLSCRKRTSSVFGASVSLIKAMRGGDVTSGWMRFRLSWYCNEVVRTLLDEIEPGTTVALLLSGPGRGPASTIDLRWRKALTDMAAQFAVPLEPVFYANDETVALVNQPSPRRVAFG